MKEGSKMPRADWQIMREFPVAIPPHAILDALSSYVCPIAQQLKLLTMQNLKLKQARDILLPKLMSGEMEV
jgi:type I restriction enzyme S subunit